VCYPKQFRIVRLSLLNVTQRSRSKRKLINLFVSGLTFDVVAGNKFQNFIEQDDRQRNLQDGDPFGYRKWSNLEDGRHDVNVQDHEMQRH
jgi:hypothetical protein